MLSLEMQMLTLKNLKNNMLALRNSNVNIEKFKKQYVSIKKLKFKQKSHPIYLSISFIIKKTVDPPANFLPRISANILSKIISQKARNRNITRFATKSA